MLLLVLEDEEAFADLDREVDVPLIVFDGLQDDWPDVIDLGE